MASMIPISSPHPTLCQLPKTPLQVQKEKPNLIGCFSLQERVYSLGPMSRKIQATEETLNKLYDGARLGLKKDSLAYHAGMTTSEFRQLVQIDPRVEEAIQGGKADAELELATLMMDAARTGDAKATLEILKCKHGWMSQSIVKQEVTGANGGPVQLSAVDLRGLSDAEIQQMQMILEKVSGPEANPNSLNEMP